MAKVTHRGPGDLITLDGLEIKKGDTLTLDNEQIRRLTDAGAELDVDRSEEIPPPEVWATPEPPALAAKTKRAEPAKED